MSRRSQCCLAGVLLASSAQAPAQDAAQSYPNRPLRIVVTFSAGGSHDILARWTAQGLAQSWGQTALVDNRPGAGGTLGSDLVAKSAPDGYTLLAGNPGPLTIAPSVYTKLPYDTLRDFAPVVLMATTTSVYCVHPSLPVRNVRELVALAKARPGSINFGSSGIGSLGHLSVELLNSMAGTKMNHIPYKGAAPATSDLIAGHIVMMTLSTPAALPFVRIGKTRAIAVSSVKRTSSLPDVPTVDESGLKGYQSYNWNGILAPAGTPREIVSRIHAEIVRLLQAPAARERLAADGWDLVGDTPQQYGEFLRAEIVKWAKVVKFAGVTPE